MKKTVFTFFFALCLFKVMPAWAQPGSLDPLFGSSGIFTGNLNTEQAGVIMTDMAVAADDKIILVGYTLGGVTEDLVVVCLGANGTLDPTFGTNGAVFIDASLGGDERATAVAVQGDGKIVVCGLMFDGTERSVLVRLNTDGTLDPTFGTSGVIGYGIVETKLWDVAIDAQNRIVAVGNVLEQAEIKCHVARFLPNGSPDNTFSGDGKTSPVLVADNMPEFLYAVAIVNGNEVVVLGTNELFTEGDLMVAKFKGDGEPDLNFADQGLFLLPSPDEEPEAGDLVVTTQGDVWFTGGVNGQGTVAKLTPSGALDPSFSQDGKLSMSSMQTMESVRVFSDRVVVGGVTVNNPDFECRTIMLKTDGTNIQNFGTSGIAEHSPHTDVVLMSSVAVGVQSTGHIVHGGGFTLDINGDRQMYVMRLLNPGFASVEENVAPELTVYPNPVSEYFQIGTTNFQHVRQVSLLSMSGGEVCTWPASAGVYHLPAYLCGGVYMLRIRTENLSDQYRLLTVKR